MIKLPSQVLSSFSIISLPIFSLIQLYLNKNKLEDPDFKKKFQTLYLNLNPWKHSAYLSTMMFTVRRIVLGISTILYTQHLIIILVFYIYTSIIQLCFYLHYMPLDTFVRNLLEIINEMFILFSAYYIIMFSSYVDVLT